MASSSSDVTTLQYINKTHKSTILLHAGHQYVVKTKYKNGSIIWECVRRRKNKCTGSITVKGNQIVKEKNHNNCKLDFAQNEIAVRLDRLKKTISDPEAPAIPTAYNMAVSSLKDTGIDKIKAFPPFKNIKSMLYNQRKAAFGVEKIQYKNVEDVEVPPAHQQFLLADYNNNGIRVIAFCSKSARNYLQNINVFLGDGTFWICTSPFQQLYTIHGDLGSTGKHINIMPLVYVLMSHKTQQAYEILFYMIKSQLPNWEPQKYMCDFEIAAMNAMRSVFKNVSVSGCYFHFTQAVWKKGKQLRLTEDSLTRRQVALSAVLPLLPVDKIVEGWFYIASQSPDDDRSKDFRQYMLKQWLKEDFVETWCVYGQQHRTTNLVEAWHKKIKKRLIQKNPNIMKLLTALSEDASFYEVLATQVCHDARGITERPIKSITRDNFIKEVQMELINGDITTGHCLEKLR